MDTAVITRFHYPRHDPRFNWRFDYYAHETLPRLLDQTDKNFDIWVWCEPHHDARFKRLHPRINVFHGTYDKRQSHLFIDYTSYERLTGLPKYPIQFGLDSDELVEPGIIEHARKLCKGEQSIHISYQPILYDVATGRKFHMKRTYGGHFGSAIFAFYQPNLGSNWKFAYHTSHIRLPKLAEVRLREPAGFVYVSVHHQNDSTRLHRHAKDY